MTGRQQSSLGSTSWSRPIERRDYLSAAIPLLLLEYGAVFWLSGSVAPWENIIDGAVNRFQPLPFASAAFITALIVLGTTVALGWLGARRAATTGASGTLATLSVLPWLQLVVIAWLAAGSRGADAESRRKSLIVVRGALWGLAIALAAEIIFTLVLGDFGLALFAGAPFLVGFVTCYIAESDGHPHPFALAIYALVLASGVLFGFAFEGFICLILALPLAAAATLAGGAVGVLLARHRARRKTMLSSVALLPFLLLAETVGPPNARFTDVRSVEVAAPPAAVWQAIVHMGRIDTAPAAPFGWGLAYPIAGHIEGEGVGAVRRGVFSTGVAYERVTRWEPGRALWFDVLTNPPMMRETNPFGPVRSAHLDGYFGTGHANFTITPLPGGRTRLTLATDHRLAIGPTAYFLPLAKWTVAENKRRVLTQFLERAEAVLRASPGKTTGL